MDSMRSLNTSLPSAPPEQLLQAFRTAALSVTNLYKAATDQTASRQAGYQDALEDLLSFLDQENLGLQDGEGWRIRQWATERYNNDRIAPDTASENGDATENNLPAREQSSQTPEPSQSESRASLQTSSPPPTQADSTITDSVEKTDTKPSASIFQFVGIDSVRGSDQMTDIENQTSAPSSDPTSTATSPQHLGRHSASCTHVRKSTVHGASRGSNRSNRDLTLNSGTKRKVQVPDFFDLSEAAFGTSTGQGGGKRGRYV